MVSGVLASETPEKKTSAGSAEERQALTKSKLHFLFLKTRAYCWIMTFKRDGDSRHLKKTVLQKSKQFFG